MCVAALVDSAGAAGQSNNTAATPPPSQLPPAFHRATRKSSVAKRPEGSDGAAGKPPCSLRKLGRGVGELDLLGRSDGVLSVVENVL